MKIRKIHNAAPEDVLMVNRLTDTCNRVDNTCYPYGDGSDFRNDGDINLFIAEKDDEAVGYLRIFAPITSEGELTILVLPDSRRKGICQGLLKMGLRELQRRSIPEYLLVCDARGDSGRSAAQALGAVYDFSEYLLRFNDEFTTKTRPVDSSPVYLMPADRSQSDQLQKIMIEAFGNQENDAKDHLETYFRDDRRHLYTIWYADRPAGVIGVYDETSAYIHGFAVAKDLRGRGIGRSALKAVVEMIQREHPGRTIELEVQTENIHALGLYESDGFVRMTEFRYFRGKV